MAANVPVTYDVFVENIPLSARNIKGSISTIFGRYGSIDRLSIREKEHFQTAFVKYTDEEAAKNAIVELNGFTFMGAPLQVSKGEQWGGVVTTHSWKRPSSPLTSRRTRDYNYGQKYHKGSGYPRYNKDPSKRKPYTSSHMWKKGTRRKIIVTHVENCWTFWGQSISEDNADLVFNVATQVKEHCTNEKGFSPRSPSFSEVYGALYEGDECWYRCKILDISDDECFIRYIDYGNTAIVKCSDLKKLPEDLQNIVTTQQFSLAGLAKPEEDDKEDKALELLRASLVDKIVTVEVVEEDGSDTISVRVFCTVSDVEVNIGEEIVKEGLATYLSLPPTTPPHSSTGSEGEGSGEVAEEPSVNLTVQKPILSAKSLKLSPVFSNQCSTERSSPTTPSNLLSNQKEMELLKLEVEQKNVHLHQLKMSQVELQNDKLRLMKEVEVLRANYKESQQQVTSLKGSIATHTRTQDKLVAAHAQLVRTHEVRVSATLEPKWLQKVTKLCDDLAEEEKQINFDKMTSISELQDAIQNLEELQQKIRECKDKETVTELVTPRNETRQKLLCAIDSFILQASDKLGDGSRLQLLEDCSEELKVFCSEGLSDTEEILLTPTDLGNVISELREWQSERQVGLDRMRCTTDDQVGHLITAFKTIIKSFTLAEADANLPEVDILFDTVSQVCNEEIKVLKRSDEDVIPEKIMATIKKVWHCVDSELKEIHMLQQLLDQYTDLKKVVEDCINVDLNTAELQDVKRSVRDLRRQLGHKLVDKKEFSDDPLNESADELQQVNGELNDIRESLHKAFSKEQNLSSFLAKYLENFPELNLLHPELGLQSCQETGGLVMMGRQLDHFTISEIVEGYPVPVYRSVYLGQPCVIKEFPVQDEQMLSVMVNKAVMLNSVEHDNVVKVIFLSPDKGRKKTLILYSSYLDEDLDGYLQQPRDPTMLRMIFRKVLCVLHCVHRSGIVYGDLSAKSVRLRLNQKYNEVEVQLVDFDLLRDTVDCCRSLNVPESAVQSHVEPSADMYCFGKLLLKAFCGHTSLKHDSNGRPSLVPFALEATLCSLLEGLLHSDPQLRISSSTSLKHDFFV